MVKEKKQINLSLSDDDQEEAAAADLGLSKKGQLNINKNYAQKYDNWRSKEEIQKRNKHIYFDKAKCVFSKLNAIL
jgi:post-segregation antitoxin (ccd killing protein)